MMISLLSAKTCASFSYVLQQQLHMYVTKCQKTRGAAIVIF